MHTAWQDILRDLASVGSGLLSSMLNFLLACRSCSEQKHFYVGDEVDSNSRVATRMSAGTGAAPGQAPPDLPSLLLDGRICYIGMPVSLLCACLCKSFTSAPMEHSNACEVLLQLTQGDLYSSACIAASRMCGIAFCISS